MVKQNTVHVVLLNKNGEVLCVSRKNNHNDFGLPGGKCDDGESFTDALIRETKEETGLDINNLTIIYSAHRNNHMGTTYFANWSGEIETDEPHVVKWGSFKDLIDGSFGVWNQEVLESCLSMGLIVKTT